MTDAAALELRHVRLAEPVTLRPASLGPTPEGGVEEGVFVALDDSPPVRTVLAVVEGERRRALEVAWVVEVAEREGDELGGPPVRGFYGRWVGDEALERAAKVGTEHLEDGMPVVQPVVYDNSVMLDVSDTNMAMPAPVIVLDGSDEDDDEDDDGSEDGTDREGREPGGELHLHAGETVSYADYGHGGEAAGSGEQAASEDAGDSGDGAEAAGEDEVTETSTDSGEAPSESADGDAGESRSKGRKKRGRRRR